MKIRRFLFIILLFGAINLNAQQQKYIRHRVRWMETLYSIARKYKANPKDIAILNNLTTGEVSRGQILLIPDPDSPKAEDIQTLPKDTVAVPDQFQPIKERIPPCRDYIPSGTYRPVVSLILPLSENVSSPGFLEFYQGVLLAVEKIKNQGMQVVLQVFDWNEQSADELLSGERLGRSDLIIGPVYSNEIGSTLAYFRHSGTKIVSPLDGNAEVWVNSSPDLFQIQPALTAQQQSLLKYLEPHYASIWIISEEGEEIVSPGIRTLLDKNLVPYRNFSYDVLQGREVTEVLRELLGSNPRNQVIIASQNEAFVSDAIRNLHLLTAYDSIPVELFGLSRWRSFETLDLTALHQLQVILPVTAYVDYSDSAVRQFVQHYRGLFHSEPSQFAFQGYDVAYYFMYALNRYGKHFEDCLENLQLPLLQTKISFLKKSGKGGYSNISTRIIRYRPDFTVELLP